MALSHFTAALETARLPFLAGSVVHEPCPGLWRILTEAGHFIEARLAGSCLVAPSETSAVLVALFQQEYYILAVLTHPSRSLNLAAETISLRSESLLIQNKVTEMQAESLHSVRAEVIHQKADKILLN